MGVYIKGMEMPITCDDCFLPLQYCPYAMKPDGVCPLVPVPPHGDLIDRKPFIQFIKTHWDSYDQWFVDQLEARPIVITADTAEEGE